MILAMTNDEYALSIKRAQVEFILSRMGDSRKLSDIEKYDSDDKTDEEIAEMFELYKPLIEKETWVDCCPSFFHISQFENQLQKQLKYIFGKKQDDFTRQAKELINSFYISVGKTNINELNLDEKQEIYWMSHPFVY